ncbi:MAG: 1-acyl-sn-glycerol-3-phosphate acyltransferase [Chloroflexi bacterium]|nr:1-acyl-sn-glycerol-3-phosphate acyltransferase [Chloroflexota bacterium]
MEFFYTLSNSMVRAVLQAFAHWTVEGRESVPPRGPLIVVANHQSNIDPPLLGASIPRRLFFLAKEGIFVNPVISAFLSNYGAFPLKRDGTDIQAFRWALRMLSRNEAIAFFPEGTRSPGRMREAIPGIALLAIRSQATLLPVGITGTERMGPLWRVAFPTGKITVRIGEPFSLPAIEGRLERSQLEALTKMVMQRVAALLPESYRGVYSLHKET